MALYLVRWREVHVAAKEVEAESEEEAIAIAQEQADEVETEFSHMLDEDWEAKEILDTLN